MSRFKCWGIILDKSNIQSRQVVLSIGGRNIEIWWVFTELKADILRVKTQFWFISGKSPICPVLLTPETKKIMLWASTEILLLTSSFRTNRVLTLKFHLCPEAECHELLFTSLLTLPEKIEFISDCLLDINMYPLKYINVTIIHIHIYIYIQKISERKANKLIWIVKESKLY